MLSPLVGALLAIAQSRMPPREAARAAQLMDEPAPSAKLNCYAAYAKPYLDFSFRFSTGYVVRCPVRIFEGQAANVMVYVRIRPAGGEPVFLRDGYGLPAIPEDMRSRTNVHALQTNFELSGSFAMGEGEYGVDLLLVDSRGRTMRHSWTVKAVRGRGEREVEVAARPNTALPSSARIWNGQKEAVGKGIRVTVLLHAAPINSRSLKLRSWDRAFLLDSLSSLLRQIPWESVRLVAFNLDQQREIFSQDSFDRSGSIRLSRALRELELGTISYDALKRPEGPAELLAGLTNREIEREQPSDVVIFLGPVTRLSQKIPAALLHPLRANAPRFFYFSYYPVWKSGSEFPDTIHSVTASRNGATIKVHSPGEMARGILKMLAQL